MNQNLNFNTNTLNLDYTNYSNPDKLNIKIPPLNVLQNELRYTTQYLTSHKLYQSAKWSGELLLGISKQSEIDNNCHLRGFILENQDNQYSFNKIYSENLDQSTDVLIIARNLFDLREFRKCANLLIEFIKDPQYQSAIFLYFYSLYMAGEIKKEEEIIENQDQSSKDIVNYELVMIERELEQLYKKDQLSDLNLYLYGLVLKDRERKEEARKVFLRTLNNIPTFWSVWLEISKLVDEEDLKLFLNQIKDHWMKNFFVSSLCLEKYKNPMCIEINRGLLCFFHNSNYLHNQIAHAFYNNQEFDISLEFFEKLVKIDPYRYENMDTYSNILYIKENQGDLANLALRCFQNNKYTSETCCAIGNYYSLMGDHVKAVIYFKKALKLDKNFLAAWTLMGHEFLEMKNIGGAIESYRNAVDYDPKDFRAWYGLGQTYELQNMNHYALYYFTRAVMSRPKDSRMWNAMGNCFEKMEKKNEAVRCYERAESCKDKECIALYQLAKLYDLIGLENKAVKCFEENLQRKDDEQIVDKEVGECLFYLAKYYNKKQEFEKAFEYARRLYDFNGPERDEANTILYEINKNLGIQNQYSNSNFKKLSESNFDI